MVSRLDSRFKIPDSATRFRRVAVITHFYSPGPAHELVGYLAPRVAEVVFFGQPLPAKAESASFLRVYRGRQLVTERLGGVWPLPDLVRYIKDVLSVGWFVLTESRFDLIIALDPLNVAAVRLVAWLKGRSPIVDYTIDYIPHRFTNRLLNRFYHWLDRTGVAASDWTWNLSPRMAEARAERWGTHRYDKKQLTVPIGTHELPASSERRAASSVVFMGHLRAGQGVETVLNATAIAVKQIPNLRLTIVGGGELLETLKEQARALKLTKHVEFTGFVASNDEMRRHLLEASLAIALYQDTPDNFTRYTDPGKPKEYLAAGLPVLISDVPAIARQIEAAGAGLVVDDTAEALAEAMVRFLSDPKRLLAAQSAATQLAAQFRWDRIFDAAFELMGYQFSGLSSSTGSPAQRGNQDQGSSLKHPKTWIPDQVRDDTTKGSQARSW